MASIEHSEVARLLGIAVPDCHNRFSRALKHIRERLGAPDPRDR